MNHYKLEDLAVGLEESFEVAIDGDMQSIFLGLTGDVNPMHVSSKYASDRGFEDRLVYGMLTSSFVSTLAGVYLPGEHCILQEVTISFVKPVYIGDELVVVGKVAEVDERFGRIVVKFFIKKKNSNQKVCRGKYVAGLIEEK